jgi:SAM-dependent methyltransferase
MDVSERLTTEDLARDDYLAASHLHRYGLAVELCAGLRVADLGCGTGYGSALLGERAASVTGIDVDPEVIAGAARAHGGERVSFVAADALDWLRAADPAELDALVMFEALEHVGDLDAVLEQLRRLADAGVRLVLSVPNSRTFGEVNRFHLTDFDLDLARRSLGGLGDVQWAFQHLAEGSLVLTEDATSGDAVEGRLRRAVQAEPEYANAFIAAVGFPAGALRQATATLHLVATPSHNRYMMALEQSNQELWRTNRLLGRSGYGKFDAAAAAIAARIDVLEGENWILREEKRELEERLALERGWSYAPHHRALHRAVQALKRVPGVQRAGQAMRRKALRS